MFSYEPSSYIFIFLKKKYFTDKKTLLHPVGSIVFHFETYTKQYLAPLSPKVSPHYFHIHLEAIVDVLNYYYCHMVDYLVYYHMLL